MKNQRRIKLALRRSLRARALGGAHYDRARKALDQARKLGLEPNQPIELEIPNEKTGAIETRSFILVDNFAGAEVVYRNTAVNRFDLKIVPKNPRSPKPEEAAS